MIKACDWNINMTRLVPVLEQQKQLKHSNKETACSEANHDALKFSVKGNGAVCRNSNNQA